MHILSEEKNKKPWRPSMKFILIMQNITHFSFVTF
jgi:hypothetical protein